jgi:hypothetical protein
MGVFLRLLLLAAFLWVGFILYTEAKEQSRLDQPDNTKVVLLFVGTILDGAIVATILALWIVPKIGEGVGGFFFNPGTKSRDDHAVAIRPGRPHRALPGDPGQGPGRYARDQRDRPHLLPGPWRYGPRRFDHRAGARERVAAEQSSFLANRLADIYLLQDDLDPGPRGLMQIAQNMAGTKFAANAQHRMHEIDRAIDRGQRSRAPLRMKREEAG